VTGPTQTAEALLTGCAAAVPASGAAHAEHSDRRGAAGPRRGVDVRRRRGAAWRRCDGKEPGSESGMVEEGLCGTASTVTAAAGHDALPPAPSLPDKCSFNGSGKPAWECCRCARSSRNSLERIGLRKWLFCCNKRPGATSRSSPEQGSAVPARDRLPDIASTSAPGGRDRRCRRTFGRPGARMRLKRSWRRSGRHARRRRSFSGLHPR
jgi:hypothetical protein